VTTGPNAPPLLLMITGVMAAGKSTVAQALAERLPRSVHLRGDTFRRMIVRGRVGMGPSASSEALAQLRLRYRAAAKVAALYRQSGFSVIYQDVILGPMLREVLDLYPAPKHVVVLCPSPEVVAAREAARPKTGYTDFSVEQLDHTLRTETPHVGLWLDTSDLTVDQTVTRILKDLEMAP